MGKKAGQTHICVIPLDLAHVRTSPAGVDEVVHVDLANVGNYAGDPTPTVLRLRGCGSR